MRKQLTLYIYDIYVYLYPLNIKNCKNNIKYNKYVFNQYIFNKFQKQETIVLYYNYYYI